MAVRCIYEYRGRSQPSRRRPRRQQQHQRQLLHKAMSLLARATAAGVQCNAFLVNGTGMNLQSARSNVQSFCQNFASQTIGTDQQQQQQTNLTTVYKPSSGNSDTRIAVTFIGDCGSTTTTTYTIDRTVCENIFYRILDSCPRNANVPEKGLGYFGGTAQEGCAAYSISSSISESLQCGNNPYSDASSIYKEAFDKAVDGYCSTSLTVAPNFVRPNGFQQSIPNGQSFANVVMEDGLLVKILTKFNDQNQEGCAEPMAFETKGEECRRKLRALWGHCGGEGGVVLENGERGCVVWSVWGRRV